MQTCGLRATRHSSEIVSAMFRTSAGLCQHDTSRPARTQPCQTPTELIDGVRVGLSWLPSHSQLCPPFTGLPVAGTGRKGIVHVEPLGNMHVKYRIVTVDLSPVGFTSGNCSSTVLSWIKNEPIGGSFCHQSSIVPTKRCMSHESLFSML